MPCSLEKNTGGIFDFKSQNHSTSTIKCTANGNARFVSARINHTDLQIQNGDTINFMIDSGVNILKLVIAVANPNDTIKILEVCGSSQTQVLDEYLNDPSDPVSGYSIYGF